MLLLDKRERKASFGHYHSNGDRDKLTIQRRIRLRTKTAIRGDCATVSAVPTWWYAALLHYGELDDPTRRKTYSTSRTKLRPSLGVGSIRPNDRLPKTTTVQSAVKDYYVYNRPSKTTAVSTVPKATVNGSAKDSFRLLSHRIIVVLCAFEKNIRLTQITHNLSLRAQLLARRPNNIDNFSKNPLSVAIRRRDFFQSAGSPEVGWDKG